MPEDDLSIASWHAKILEQRGSGVAERVHADLAYAVLIADAEEGTHEVARLDRSARPGREDETRKDGPSSPRPSRNRLTSAWLLLALKLVP
jgi:hypothetical protein